jgi:hypothetical protein
MAHHRKKSPLTPKRAVFNRATCDAQNTNLGQSRRHTGALPQLPKCASAALARCRNVMPCARVGQAHFRPVHSGKCGNDFLLAPGTKKSLIFFQRNEGISQASEVMLHSVAERSQDADPAPIPLPGTCLLVTPAARSALLQGPNRRCALENRFPWWHIT